MIASEKELELYVHIPFCVQKCLYCDFLSMPVDEVVRRHYVNQLIEEIEQKAGIYSGYRVPTIFFGGGTPSILSDGQIVEMMEALQSNFHIEKDAEIMEYQTKLEEYKNQLRELLAE